MYQGENPIAIKSQHMILDAFNDLLKEKEYRDISIREICERSGISRQTFYKLFGSKENVVLFRLRNSPYSSETAEENESTCTLMETCTAYSKYVVANYRQMQMLLDNNLMEVLYTQIYTDMYTCRRSFVDINDEEREYAAQFTASGLCRLTQKYIREHEKPDQTELLRLSYKIMSGSIYKE